MLVYFLSTSVICLIISVYILTMIKRMTIPFIVALYLVMGLFVVMASPYTLIVLGLLLSGLVYKKIALKRSEDTNDFDFSGTVYSLSMLANKLTKKKGNTIIGEVLPISRKELPYNRAKVAVDDTILSGATLVTGATGSGKSLHKSTLIPTCDGMVRLENAEIGDIVFDSNGAHTEVIDKYCPHDTRFFELVFADGTKVKAGGGHLWDIVGHGIIDTTRIYDYQDSLPLYITPVTHEVEYRDRHTELPIDPFLLGDFLCTGLIPRGYEAEIEALGLSSHIQFVPDMYKTASPSDRWALVNGFRSALRVDGRDTMVVHTSPHLLAEIKSLVQSFGYGTTDVQPHYEYQLYWFEVELSDKKPHAIVSIIEIHDNPEDYFCLAVDSDTHMFLCTESFIPTHNTTSLLSLLKQSLKLGKPVAFFDYKGEIDILDELEDYAKRLGVPYFEFSSRRCDISYDPLINLNETGRVEALMNTRRWDASGADEHYKTSTQLAIQNIIRGYDAERAESGDTRSYIIGLQDYAGRYKPGPNERDGVNTLVKQLEILLTSRAQLLFNNEGKAFSFEDMNGPCIVCFSFVSANKQLANSLSSFIFQDILDRGTRRKYEPKLLLGIDEFGTLESSTLIKDILEKGRSGGCQTIFSILDINQIAMSAGEHFVNAILGTINSFVIHAGATQQTADLLAGVQKYSNKGYSIMDLRKPYNGRPPTALFISKYPLLDKKGNQEMYRIIPHTGGAVDTIKEAKSEKSHIYHISNPEDDIFVDIPPEVFAEVDENLGTETEEHSSDSDSSNSTMPMTMNIDDLSKFL